MAVWPFCTAQKMKVCILRISSVNVSKSAGNSTEEILNGNLHFLCSAGLQITEKCSVLFYLVIFRNTWYFQCYEANCFETFWKYLKMMIISRICWSENMLMFCYSLLCIKYRNFTLFSNTKILWKHTVFVEIRANRQQKHCVKSVCIRSYSGRHFSRIFPHSDGIRRDTAGVKCGKNADQNNSEYRHFLRSEKLGEMVLFYAVLIIGHCTKSKKFPFELTI